MIDGLLTYEKEMPVRTVGAYEARTHLAQLLDEVERGAMITITRHGVAVATLVPENQEKRSDVQATIEALREFRSGVEPLAGLRVRDMIETGRRL